MSRFTPGALPSDSGGSSPDSDDCWQQQHSLPFNSGSAAWMQDHIGRPAAEERMARLVKTLEAEVIPRLVEAHRAASTDAPAADCATPALFSQEDVEAFVKLTMNGDDAQVLAFVETYRQRGASIESICLDLLAPTAARFGDMWLEDLCDFTAVTLGVGRLQHLLQRLTPLFGSEVRFPANARRIALVPAPGEQHTFGLSMVAEFFVQSGWDVMGVQGAGREEASDLVTQQWFDVIGFSVGVEARIDWLTECIKAVRAASSNPDIRVMVGGPIFKANPGLVALVGADATSADAKQAVGVAERMVFDRARQR